ncbi:MAG: methionine biosynthesis protein MetW, partial [bacterium]|nr:methionine biosynthesis protein MetW [bacterium]
PISNNLPYQWFETPNIHYFTTKDFILFCKQKNHKILQSVYTANERRVTWFPNVSAEQALYVLSS